MRDLEGERLFDEDVLAHFQRTLGQAVVLLGRSGDYDSFHVLAPKDFFVRSGDIYALVLLLQFFQLGLVHVTDDAQSSELVEIADEILSPISATYDGNCDVIIHGSHSPWHFGRSTYKNQRSFARRVLDLPAEVPDKWEGRAYRCKPFRTPAWSLPRISGNRMPAACAKAPGNKRRLERRVPAGNRAVRRVFRSGSRIGCKRVQNREAPAARLQNPKDRIDRTVASTALRAPRGLLSMHPDT